MHGINKYKTEKGTLKGPHTEQGQGAIGMSVTLVNFGKHRIFKNVVS